MIDYVLTEPQYFSNIRQFTSGVFNTFSDHAPIRLTIVASCISNGKGDNAHACRAKYLHSNPQHLRHLG